MSDQAWENTFRQSIPGTPPAVFRGIVERKNIHACISAGKDFYYMDTGYFGNFRSEGNPSGRKLYHRIVKNELQKSTIENKPVDRWEALVRGDQRLKWPGWKKVEIKFYWFYLILNLVIILVTTCSNGGIPLSKLLKNTQTCL